MSYFGFYMIDPLQNIKWGDVSTVAMKVSEWLDPIVKKAGFEFPLVCFPQYIVTPQPHELMVYICSYEQSVVQSAPGGKGQIPDPKSSSHKGITLLGPPAASEVYIKETNPIETAALIFHEAMHNKLQKNNGMHGLFPNPIMSATFMSITAEMSPTSAEAEAMANALKNPVPQWTGGQEMMWKAAKRRESGDQFWDDKLTYKI